MKHRMQLIDLNILEALESPEYKELAGLFQERRFNKKAMLAMPDHQEDLVILVKSGRLRVFLAYEDKEFTLAILEGGDVYSSHTRAYVQALDEENTVLVADTRSFSQTILRFPQFSLIMVKVLGDLLRNSITIINGLVFKETHLRLAEFLVQAAREKGEVLGTDIKINLGLNVEEIATMLGATRQTVSLLLNDFYKSGILKKEGRGIITIKDMEQLEELTKE